VTATFAAEFQILRTAAAAAHYVIAADCGIANSAVQTTLGVFASLCAALKAV
jgi:hypothetical protein